MSAQIVALGALGLTLLAGCGSPAGRRAIESSGIAFTPERFLTAVREGDAETVQRFLAAGMSPATRDLETHTALMWAAQLGHEGVAAELLRAGAPVNDRVQRMHLIEIPFMTEVRREAGMTALMYAIRGGHPAIARRLIERGADVHDVDPAGSWSMVALACLMRDSETLHLLLERGARADHLDNMGRTALFVAAMQGDERSVQSLLAHHAAVNARSRIRPETPLIVAVQGGNADVVRMLLDGGADPSATDHYGRSALVYAEATRRTDLTDLLRRHGVTETGLTEDRLLEALQHRDLATAEEMLRRGANPNARFQNRMGDEPALVLAARFETGDAVRALLAAGADPRGTGWLGDTPLHAAANVGSAESIPLLIKAGCDPEARDRNQWTALLEAAHSGKADCVRALLEGGARVDGPMHNGATPLMVAARGGDVSAREAMNAAAAEVLIAAHAGLDAVDDRGNTALLYAVQMGRPAMVDLLLRAGADPHRANQAGETPLSTAIARRNAAIEQRLREAGATR